MLNNFIGQFFLKVKQTPSDALSMGKQMNAKHWRK